jgi:hypothetical protein
LALGGRELGGPNLGVVMIWGGGSFLGSDLEEMG